MTRIICGVDVAFKSLEACIGLQGAAGKPPKVVRIALAHKLLVRLNAKAREVRQQMTTLESESTALIAQSR